MMNLSAHNQTTKSSFGTGTPSHWSLIARLGCLLILASSLPLASSFISNGATSAVTVHPDLEALAKAQLGQLLKIRLDIASNNNNNKQPQQKQQRLPFHGPIIRLLGKFDHANRKSNTDTKSSSPAFSLPGATGSTPQISTGAMTAEVVEDGYVIDLDGSRTIPFQDGCWELVWKSGVGEGSGAVVCAFNLPEPVKRNGASLSAGKVYMSFPLWTKESLHQAQAKKDEILAAQRKYNDQKEDAMAKMSETNNPFLRAKLYHDASLALQMALNVGTLKKKTHNVPDDALRDTIELSSGLLLGKKGSVFQDKSTILGKGALQQHHRELGTATVSLAKSEST